MILCLSIKIHLIHAETLHVEQLEAMTELKVCLDRSIYFWNFIYQIMLPTGFNNLGIILILLVFYPIFISPPPPSPRLSARVSFLWCSSTEFLDSFLEWTLQMRYPWVQRYIQLGSVSRSKISSKFPSSLELPLRYLCVCSIYSCIFTRLAFYGARFKMGFWTECC